MIIKSITRDGTVFIMMMGMVHLFMTIPFHHLVMTVLMWTGSGSDAAATAGGIDNMECWRLQLWLWLWRSWRMPSRYWQQEVPVMYGQMAIFRCVFIAAVLLEGLRRAWRRRPWWWSVEWRTVDTIRWRKKAGREGGENGGNNKVAKNGGKRGWWNWREDVVAGR